MPDRRDRQTEREILSRQQRPPTSAKKKTSQTCLPLRHRKCGTVEKNYERAQCSVLSVVQCECYLAEREPGTWPVGIDESSRRARHTHAFSHTDRLDTAKSWAFGESRQRRVIWQGKQAKEVRAGNGRAELNWLRSSSSSNAAA